MFHPIDQKVLNGLKFRRDISFLGVPCFKLNPYSIFKTEKIDSAEIKSLATMSFQKLTFNAYFAKNNFLVARIVT